MNRIARTATVAAAVVLIGVATSAVAAERGAAAAEFTRRMDAYLQLRGEATRWLPSPRTTSDVAQMLAVQDAIADAIRAARPHVETGNIFMPDIAAVFRLRIEEALRKHGYDVLELLEAITSEAPRESPNLAVNARFDWRFGSQTPAAIIAALPKMPSGILQYRVVGRDLVLLDLGANLIVDVLPAALPQR